MGTIEITKLGSAVLRKKSRSVGDERERICALLDKMAKVMYANKGVGLAAPQVGVDERVIIFDAGDGLVEIINPEIEHAEGSARSSEGCLSIPGAAVDVARAASIAVKGLNRDFEPVKFSLGGLPARIVQHELDHLNGVLIIDYLSFLKRKVFEKKWRKSSR